MKLYHANGGCFGYRPSPQVTLKGELTANLDVLYQIMVKVLGTIVLEGWGTDNQNPSRGVGRVGYIDIFWNCQLAENWEWKTRQQVRMCDRLASHPGGGNDNTPVASPI